MLKNKKNGKIYVGQTIRSIENRFEEHRAGRSSRCRAIYNAIQYHGWDNFEKDYYECPDEDLNFDEELLVREMGTLSPNGYNLMEGGGSSGKPSEESKQKNRDAHLGEKSYMFGIPKRDETRQKLSEAHLGKTLSEETKQKISEAKIGHDVSGETKQKMSEAKRGENNHNSKRVYQYDLDGNLIGSFASTGEAGRHLKKDGMNISACARGEQKTAYKFKWSYEISM